MTGQLHWARFALGVAAGCALAFASIVPASAIPKPGSPAPDFSMTLIANGKGTVSLATYKGKALYLNFFASWCGPCKAELPSIIALSKTYAKRGVVVLGVDELEPVAAATAFVKQFSVPYQVGIDDSGNIGSAYGLIGMPMHVFIGSDGKVVLRHPGEMSADEIRAGLDSIARK